MFDSGLKDAVMSVVVVLLGMAFGMALGHLWPQAGALLKPDSDGFVGLVKMMIAPIVFCTIVSGITSQRAEWPSGARSCGRWDFSIF